MANEHEGGDHKELLASSLSVPPPPKNLRILVVDSKAASRQNVVQLLRDCEYQVKGEALLADLHGAWEVALVQPLPSQVSSVATTKEALELACSESECPIDIILKEHEPPEVNAHRLLRAKDLLAKVPVVCESQNFCTA